MDALKRYAPHLLYSLPALAFAAAGAGKLAQTPDLLAPFEAMGLPWAFGMFIGLSELAGAAGLIWFRTRIVAARGLSVILLGAVYFHVAYGIPSPIPALVLLALLIATIAVFRTGHRVVAS